MNFSSLHERLRIEIARRIDRGILTSALLARQTGLTPAHISNFLNRKRMLSLRSLDRVLAALSLSVADLSVDPARYPRGSNRELSALDYESVPLVTESTAIFDAQVRSRATLGMIKVGSELLKSARDKCSARRRNWDRFVAVAVTGQQAEGMNPLLLSGTIVLIDRHYNSTVAYSQARPTLYAVRRGNLLHFRYATLVGRRLVLSAHRHTLKPDLVELPAGQTSADLLVGRVFLTIAEI